MVVSHPSPAWSIPPPPPPPTWNAIIFCTALFLYCACANFGRDLVQVLCHDVELFAFTSLITKRWCLGEFTVSVHQMSPFVISTTTRQADSSKGDPTRRRSWSCIIIRNVCPPACYSWEVPDEKLTFTEWWPNITSIEVRDWQVSIDYVIFYSAGTCCTQTPVEQLIEWAVRCKRLTEDKYQVHHKTHGNVPVCVCAYMCVRACVRACMHACVCAVKIGLVDFQTDQ